MSSLAIGHPCLRSMTPDQLSDVNKLRLGDPVLCVVRDVYKDRLMVTLDLKKPEELMERLDDLRFNNTPRSQSTNTVSAYNSTSSKTAKDRSARSDKPLDKGYRPPKIVSPPYP